MTVTPLFPDLGAPKLFEAGGMDLLNAAGVLELAKRSGTAQSMAFLKAFNAEWRRLDGQPMTDKARQNTAMRAAIKSLGHTIKDLGTIG